MVCKQRADKGKQAGYDVTERCTEGRTEARPINIGNKAFKATPNFIGQTRPINLSGKAANQVKGRNQAVADKADKPRKDAANINAVDTFGKAGAEARPIKVFDCASECSYCRGESCRNRLTEQRPVNTVDQSAEALRQPCGKPRPIKFGNKQIQHIEDRVKPLCYGVTDITPVDSVNERIKASGNALDAVGNGIFDVIPANKILDLLDGGIDAVSDDLTDTGIVAVSERLFDLLNEICNAGFNGDFLKHFAGRRGPAIAGVGAAAPLIQFIEPGNLTLCVLCGVPCGSQRRGVIFLYRNCLRKGFRP